mmetsp:Transcript_26945/g.48813  ORF Transcript_26945/g.48813 Transcript_26945/m.48813 type:complete len:207 (-) Transcript_26945:978-1598(-)
MAVMGAMCIVVAMLLMLLIMVIVAVLVIRMIIVAVMAFIGMITMIGVIIFVFVVIIFVFGVIVMVIFMFITMIVMIFATQRHLKESFTLAELQLTGAVQMKQFQRRGVACQRVNRLFQHRGKLGADPNHQFRVLQRAGLGRTHGIVMWGNGCRQQLLRGAHPIHNPSDKRLNRRNICHDLWCIRLRGKCYKRGCEGRADDSHVGNS